MKRPKIIAVYPLDIRKDEDRGLWFRVPKWIVRAYSLKDYGTNMGKVKFTIREDKRAIEKYMKEKEVSFAHVYFIKNWMKKLKREEQRKKK